MKKYIISRLAISLVTLWVIVTVSFFLIHALPGNPFAQTRLMSQEMIDQLNKYYGLDNPLTEQYLVYMKNLLRGDFGYSIKYSGQTVNSIIMKTFPVSAS